MPISGYTYYLKAADLTLSNSNTIADVTNANHIWTVLSGSSTGKWKLKYGNNYLKAAVSGTHYDIGLTTSYNATGNIGSFASITTISSPSLIYFTAGFPDRIQLDQRTFMFFPQSGKMP